MRFTRTERYEPLIFNERRRNAFARKQQRERDRYPLFPDQVAQEQHSPSEEAARRQRQSDRYEQRMRDLSARVWRKSRAAFFAQPEEIKAEIRTKWATWTGPTTCTYFAWVVDELSGEQARRRAEAARQTAEIRRRVRAAIGEQIELEVV
ncbi:hypothetical protein [Cupriavidus basilensis]|uniref:hypothetical protein n=1 Tax=Cupriavidus basilensis TaxID=68895 RepID=UPI000750FFCA|nr:hypothetical protein [Cupriavidus basilensis]